MPGAECSLLASESGRDLSAVAKRGYGKRMTRADAVAAGEYKCAAAGARPEVASLKLACSSTLPEQRCMMMWLPLFLVNRVGWYGYHRRQTYTPQSQAKDLVMP